MNSIRYQINLKRRLNFLLYESGPWNDDTINIIEEISFIRRQLELCCFINSYLLGFQLINE